MSAIQSNQASILLPAYSKTSSRHGASCNCSSCSGHTLSSSTASTIGQTDSMTDNPSQSSGAGGTTDAMGRQLSKSRQAEVAQLKKTDADVRRHEQAHLSAAGGYARSGIVLNFKAGPDGKQYAVGGHVDIDTSKVAGNPSATIAKMQVVERAALAPADPSGQDRNVAAQAAQTASQAQAQLAQAKQDVNHSGTAGGVNGTATGARQAIATKFSQISPGSWGGGSSPGQLLDVTA